MKPSQELALTFGPQPMCVGPRVFLRASRSAGPCPSVPSIKGREWLGHSRDTLREELAILFLFAYGLL